MKILIKVKDVKIKMDDSNNDSFTKYDTRVEFVVKIIKSMSDEAIKLLKERQI